MSSITKRAKIPTLEAAHAIVTAGKVSFSKPKENKQKGGFSIYPRNDTVPGGPLPQWVNPRLTTPFKPDYGKFKTEINKWTNLDMEMSVRDDEVGRKIVAFYTAIDAMVRKVVMDNSETLYRKKMSEEEANFKHRKCLIPHKKSGAFPYLLRIKCHPTKTKYWKVVGVDPDTQKNICRKGTVDDVVPWSEVLPAVDWTGVYASAMSFGATFFARKSMFWEPQTRARRDEEDENDDDVDDMGDEYQVAPAEEGDEAADEAATAEGGGSGSGKRTADAMDADTDTNEDGGDGGGRNKRVRMAPETAEDDAVGDDAYANSDED
jgi:hypothetical protein